ncbi:MAG: hypothetical protein RSC68_01050 [Acinetobacter sp.]
MNTVYTISGIMFSIGMGVLCTLNPDKVKNNIYYQEIKNNIIDVRNSYIAYFVLISTVYLVFQLYPAAKIDLYQIKNFVITAKVSYAVIALNILGILYFIANFIEIQRLGFEISDKTRVND